MSETVVVAILARGACTAPQAATSLIGQASCNSNGSQQELSDSSAVAASESALAATEGSAALSLDLDGLGTTESSVSVSDGVGSDEGFQPSRTDRRRLVKKSSNNMFRNGRR